MAPFSFTKIEQADDPGVSQRKKFESADAFFDAMLRKGFEVGPKDGTAIIGSLFDKKRRIDSIECVTALILDFDGKTGKKDSEGKDIYEFLDPDLYIGKLPFKGFAYASYNHTPEFPRFRVIYPFEKPLTVGEFAKVWQWANSQTNGKMDPQCKDPGHLFYLPRRRAAAVEGNFHWMRIIDGPMLSMNAVPADFVYDPAQNHKDIVDVPDMSLPTERTLVTPLLEALNSLPLFKFAQTHPDEISRIAWRAICTSLAFAAEEVDEESELAACRMFHEISRYDKRRYRANVTQKEWATTLAKVKSKDLRGPLSYQFMVDSGVSADLCKPLFPSSKNLLTDARKLDRGEVPGTSPSAPASPSKKPAVSVLPKNLGKPPEATGATNDPAAKPTPTPAPVTPTKPAQAAKPKKFTPRSLGDDDDEGAHNYGALTGREDEFLRDRSSRGRVWYQRDSNGQYVHPMTDDGFTHYLAHHGPMNAKAVTAFKSLCRGFTAQAPIFNSKEPIVEIGSVTYLNTYRPSDIVPVQGNWDDLKRMIFFLCSNDLKGYEFFMGWLARQLQSLYLHGKPIKMGTTVVFKGDQGTGKGLMQYGIELMYGRQNCVKLSQDDLESQFNSLIEGKLFVTCNEVMSSTNRTKQTANKMKEWVTEYEVRLEKKGQDTGLPAAHFNMIYTSNDEQPVYVEATDRRHTFFESEGVLPKAAYEKVVADLGTPIDPGPRTQLAAMFYELLHRPLTTQIGEIYHTSARQYLIDATRDSDVMFADEIAQMGLLSVGESWRSKGNPNLDPHVIEVEAHPGLIPAASLREVYADFCRQQGHRGAKRYSSMIKTLKKTFPAAVSTLVKIGGVPTRCWKNLPMQASPEIEEQMKSVVPMISSTTSRVTTPAILPVDTAEAPKPAVEATASATVIPITPETVVASLVTPAPTLAPGVVVATPETYHTPRVDAPPDLPHMGLERYGEVPPDFKVDVSDDDSDESDDSSSDSGNVDPES